MWKTSLKLHRLYDNALDANAAFLCVIKDSNNKSALLNSDF